VHDDHAKHHKEAQLDVRRNKTKRNIVKPALQPAESCKISVANKQNHRQATMLGHAYSQARDVSACVCE